MKKVFSLLMAVAVFATTLWFSVGTASAAALTVVLHVDGATEANVKEATVFVNSEYHNAYCVLQDAETGKVVCKVSEKFAHEGAVLYIAGQAFYLELPSAPEVKTEEEQPLVCDVGEVAGAYVQFTYKSGGTVTYFVSGDTLSDVADHAERLKGFKFSSYTIDGGLFCSET